MKEKLEIKFYAPKDSVEEILKEGVINREAFKEDIINIEISYEATQTPKTNTIWKVGDTYKKASQFEWVLVNLNLVFNNNLTIIKANPLREKELSEKFTPSIIVDSFNFPKTLKEIEPPYSWIKNSDISIGNEIVNYLILDNKLLTFTGSLLPKPYPFGNSIDVEIPEGVEEIADCAFEEAAWIDKVTFPKSLKKIGKKAFKGCQTKAIKFPKNLEIIDDEAFFGTGGNKANWDVNLPSIKWIGDRGLALSTDMKQLKLGKNLEHIGEFAFGESRIIAMSGKFVTEDRQLLVYDHKLLKATSSKERWRSPKEDLFIIPEEVEEICSFSIQDRNIVQLQLPQTLKYIRRNAIRLNGEICSMILPESLESIEETSLKGNFMPSGKFVIPEINAIIFDSKLIYLNLTIFKENEIIKIPEGVTSIEENSTHRNFGCQSSIELPSSLKEIKDNNFSPYKIYYRGSLQDWFEINYRNLFDLFALCEEFIVSGSSITSLNIPEGIKVIDEKKFSKAKFLKNVKFPKSLERISGYAFFCSGLREIEIPENIEFIGKSSFEQCQDLDKAILRVPVNCFEDFGDTFSDYTKIFIPKEFMDEYKSVNETLNKPFELFIVES